ncbi:MAG: hypothetical protein ACTHMC_23780 [Pseudobacter sp.]|uniref:hypothetical protein n=1 Tax=Pseudobacter sp. TaxID=2045420 RepID=UPI003F7E005B
MQTRYFVDVPFSGLFKIVNSYARHNANERPVFTLRQRQRTTLAYILTASRLN